MFETFSQTPAIKDFTPARIEGISELLFSDNKATQPLGTLSERRLKCIEEFKLFGGADYLLADDKNHYNVYLSEKLNALTNQLLEKYHH